MTKEQNLEDKWHLIKKGAEYFAEKEVILPYSEIKKKVLFRDFNGDVLSLSEDKEWAKQWIYDRNEIEREYITKNN